MNPLRLAQKIFGTAVPVLCYHQVRPGSGMTPEKFGRHLDLLARLGFRTMSLTRLLDVAAGRAEPGEPAVVVTFDDCTVDNWVYAVPELAKRGMTGVFFAITDFLAPGPVRPYADQTTHPPPAPPFFDIMTKALRDDPDGFMTHGEIRALVHDLGMEVYAHSAAHQACFTHADVIGTLGGNMHWSHPFLCDPSAPADTPVHPVGSAYAHAGFGLDWHGRPLELDTEDKRLAFCLEDFSRARTCLESILEQPCPFLCLPWGQYDQITLDAAKRAGYASALSLDRTRTGKGTDPMRMGRLAVSDHKSMLWLATRTLRLALGGNGPKPDRP